MANQDNTRPEDLLHKIDRFVQESNLDRPTYLREVLQKGFSLDKQDRLLLDNWTACLGVVFQIILNSYF